MKINSKQTGRGLLSPLQSAVSISMVFGWIAIIAAIYLLGMPTWAVFAVMIVLASIIAVVFFVVIVDKTRFNRIVTYIRYRLRVRRGESSIHTFVLPLNKLKEHIPIENIHDNGLIEYTGKKYGVLFRYDPPPVAKSDLTTFHKGIEHVTNSFANDVEASFHFYNMIDRSNKLADTILRSMNTEGKTVEQKIHLHGMYEEATSSEEAGVVTEYLLSIKLGKFKSPEHAMIAYKSTIPGLLKLLREKGIYSTQVVGVNNIAIEFKKFSTMEAYRCQ